MFKEIAPEWTGNSCRLEGYDRYFVTTGQTSPNGRLRGVELDWYRVAANVLLRGLPQRVRIVGEMVVPDVL